MVFGLYVTVTLTSPKKLPIFVDHFGVLYAHSHDALVEAGTLSYELLRSTTDAAELVIMERYATEKDLELHSSTPAFNRFISWLLGDAQKPSETPLEGTLPDDEEPLAAVVKSVTLQKASNNADEGVNGSADPVVALHARSGRRIIRDAEKNSEPIRDGVAVFCGARNGARPEYLAAGKAVGEAIGRAGRRLVYGGGTVGIMGAVANAVATAGGDIIGVLPTALAPREVSGSCIGRVALCSDMSIRKTLMLAAADTVVVLPGGLGTLDELFEVLTLFQLNYSRPRVLLVNVAGFFDPLIALLRHMVAEGFVDKHVFTTFLLYNGEPAGALDAVNAKEIVPAEAELKWELPTI